jgi:hypothetical protein
MFGHVNSDVRKRGQFYLFYTYHGISGGAVLAALVAGDAAIQLEKLSQQQAVGEVMCLLRSIYGPQGVDVPDPLQVRGVNEGLWVGSQAGGGGHSDCKQRGGDMSVQHRWGGQCQCNTFA